MNIRIEDFYIHFTENAKEVAETLESMIQIIKKQNEEISLLKQKVQKLESDAK